MDVSYWQLLREHDDPIRWEYPSGFDHLAAIAKFEAFSKELSLSLGLPLKTETGSYIQDASFHSQIYVPQTDDRYAQVRFSNFGNMVSVFSVFEDQPVTEDMLEIIKVLLEKHGYVYVPESILDQPYTGRNPGVTGISNWATRFFDWV